MRRAIVVLLLVLTACGGAEATTTADEPVTHTLTGYLQTGERCWETGVQEAEVVVKDGDGSVIAKGITTEDVDPSPNCGVEFTVEDVPEVAFYTVEIAGREGPTWSLEEMEAAAWDVGLNLPY